MVLRRFSFKQLAGNNEKVIYESVNFIIGKLVACIIDNARRV